MTGMHIVEVFDTLTREKHPLNIKPNGVLKMYTCGVTVYDSTHIGHARTYVAFDVIKRYLISRGYNVKHVQNFTDVDDKIIKRATDLGIPAKELAERYIKDFLEVSQALDLLPPDCYPRATGHISEMIQMIVKLVEKGQAYITENGVYFDVTTLKDYGKLSHSDIKKLQAGSRVEIDTSKKNPLDFALWKFYDSEPSWDSPWGKGRPGWHIECSAMALKHLGETIDIHGGGGDLIFPHHENEIAQSEALTGKTFSRNWMHTGLLTVRGERMGKSLGNFITVKDMINEVGPNVLRLMLIGSHYRSPLDFDDKIVKNAQDNFKLVENAFGELLSVKKEEDSLFHEVSEFCLKTTEDFEKAMDDDFNTAIALSIFMKLVREINKYASMGKLNTVNSDPFRRTFNDFAYVFGLRFPVVMEQEKKTIENLVKERNLLRKKGEYGEADKIRKYLNTLSVELVDYPDRTIWYKKLTSPIQ
jgi:cysteinyl-tRNA synthetase